MAHGVLVGSSLPEAAFAFRLLRSHHGEGEAVVVALVLQDVFMSAHVVGAVLAAVVRSGRGSLNSHASRASGNSG